MKKRFVAKQVGVLSLTAVLAGMPAVNVLAEDVYQEKVGEVQTEAEKALLRAALNVSFVTEYGENVGNTYVESDLLWPWDSYTFKLGTDYNLPEGWELVGTAEDKTVKCGETASVEILVKPVAAETVTTRATINFKTIYGEEVGKTVAETTATGEGDWTFMLGTDYQLPEGYQLATGVEQTTNVAVPFGATAGHTMIVEKTQKLQINQIQRIRKSQIRRTQKNQIKIIQTKMTGKHRIRIKRQRIKLKHQKQVMIFKPQVHFQS